MIRKRQFVTVLSAAALALTLGSVPAQAAPEGRGLDPRPSTAKLARELQALEWLSLGEVDVTTLGKTNQGRPVWGARVGHGKLRIQYVTQQHGDEPLGTPAALEFLRKVGVGHSPWQRWLRSKVTVDIVVRANPDGHEHNWRYNYDPEAFPEYGEHGKGYDLNRYHNPSMAPELNPATESGLVQRRYAAFKPEIMVDYHMQGRYLDAQGKEITASVLWPTNAGVKKADVDFAKQITVVAQQSINGHGGNVSQYPGGDYEGIARNAYGLRGSGSVLIELSAMDSREQAQIQDALASMLAIAQKASDGSLRGVDPAKADAIPLRGPEIPTAARVAEPALD
ncbi:M14 family zinc carboxypeptidase [Amycolatopsis sp. NPDC059657]|uniref:M14 family zinc carboxypeptidase n=1 Tax=Amycolatopsis sp. NPDC059657 TaxID=3346899 RepID=UPI00366C7B02